MPPFRTCARHARRTTSHPKKAAMLVWLHNANIAILKARGAALACARCAALPMSTTVRHVCKRTAIHLLLRRHHHRRRPIRHHPPHVQGSMVSAFSHRRLSAAWVSSATQIHTVLHTTSVSRRNEHHKLNACTAVRRPTESPTDQTGGEWLRDAAVKCGRMDDHAETGCDASRREGRARA